MRVSVGKTFREQEATMTPTAKAKTQASTQEIAKSEPAKPGAGEPDPSDSPLTRIRRSGVPRWLALSLMSVFLLLVAGALWAVANTQGGCGFIDDAPSGSILPGPQPCAPDATSPALVTIWLIALLLAAAFVVAFTLVRRRGTVLLVIAGAMLFVAIIGGIATIVAASTVPPIIYY
jgi:hypothetical protein